MASATASIFVYPINRADFAANRLVSVFLMLNAIALHVYVFACSVTAPDRPTLWFDRISLYIESPLLRSVDLWIDLAGPGRGKHQKTALHDRYNARLRLAETP